MLFCMAIFTAGCDSNDMDGSSLNMDGDDFITSFAIDGQEGEIDNVAKTITVWLEPGTDVTALTPVFTLSEGAKADIPSGTAVDFTMPVVYRITNGSTYADYTVTVKVFSASVLSLTLTSPEGTRYNGEINNEEKTIRVYVAVGEPLDRLTIGYTLSEGAGADITEGAALDFTQPVKINVTSHGITTGYTITVVATDMPVTAFIGTAAAVDGLKDEERAAARWMLANVPRSIYVAMPDLISGKVQLDPAEVKAVWWHGDDNTWPSQAWDSRDAIKNYYARGGSLMLSRYACRYINDVYQIAIDQKQPNAESKNDPAKMLDAPLGFVVDDAAHPVFKDMNAVKDGQIYLIDAGFATTDCCVNWNLWDYPGHSLEGWQTATGGRRLAYQADDSNKTAIVEFPARSASAGRVVLIGTGGFEWNIAGDNGNRYAANRMQLANNVLRYLTGLNN